MLNETPEDLLSLTVPQLIARRAAALPVALALSARSVQGGRTRLGYAQLAARMERMGAEFAAMGLGQGDRIAFLLGNEAGLECFLAALGALRIGAAVSPLNTRQSDAELGHALELIEPNLVLSDAAGVQRLRGLAPGVRLLGLGPDLPADVAVWPDPEDTGRAPPPAAPPAPLDPDLLGCLLFTSGTTARAKAVMHSHRTMIGAGLCCSTALGLGPDDLYQGGWPIFTSSGLNLGAMSSWVSGAGLVFEEPLDNAGRLRLIAQEQSTFYHGVPSVVQFLIGEYEKGGHDIRSLRRLGYGGSAMPGEVVRRIDMLWPDVEQVEIFGMTESGPTGTVLPVAERMRRFGTIGRAMPYCTVRVIDSDGRDVPAGQTGEIHVSSPGVSPGYWRNPKATAEAFRFGGICTGDVGHYDADGFLHYTDRRKDVINRGGLKISSVAVEEVLYRHPGIHEAAAVAVSHPALGEDVAACVVPRPGMTLDFDDLRRFCAGEVADYAVPRRWHILTALPRNPMGKVLKRELRAMLEASQG